MLAQGDFTLYFGNSLIVTIVSLFLILLLGAMAAFALAEYQFPGNTLVGLFMALGIMIPIRLGTVGILELMVRLGLVNTLTALDPGLHRAGIAAGDLHPLGIHARRVQGPQGRRAGSTACPSTRSSSGSCCR